MMGPLDGIWMLAAVAPIAAIGLAVFWRYRKPRDETNGPVSLGVPGDEAIELLKTRYAAGQIDEEEFERRVESLLRH